jgi:uncharacterized protein (DUF1697 family)
MIMRKCIAFLRAINVGGHRVLMDELCRLFVDAGMFNVQTFLASGNVIFDKGTEDATILEDDLERQFSAKFGFESKIMIRSLEELQTIGAYGAFPSGEIEHAGAFNVAFLKRNISADAEKNLMALQNELDRFHVHGKEVYWLCAAKQSESKFSNVVLEKTTGLPSTLRGISTIDKLIKKYA